MNTPVLSVKNLVKRYKEKTALDHFNLEVAKGEVLGLLGPNGCGKTTAINCILSLLKYGEGDIRIFNEPMCPGAFALKRRIGLVPQEVSVYYDFTVKQNIDYFCGLYVDNAPQRKVLVREAIDFTGLNDYESYKAKKLSGGLLRRLNIACGIAHKPELVFLDEPTVAVDAQSRNFILSGIKALAQNGSAVVYTTHYLEEAETLCDRIVIMDNGRGIANGTLAELKKLSRTSEKAVVEFASLHDTLHEDLLISFLSIQSKAQGTKEFAETPLTIFIADKDHSALSQQLIVYLQSKHTVISVDGSGLNEETLLKKMRKDISVGAIDAGLIIRDGFERKAGTEEKGLMSIKDDRHRSAFISTS